jgi:acyl carrier protein
VLQDTVIKEISAYLKCQPEDITLDMQPEDITLDMRLDELGIDSLGAITIMYELEDKLDVEIPNEVFDSLKIVNDIVSQLEQLMANKNS